MLIPVRPTKVAVFSVRFCHFVWRQGTRIQTHLEIRETDTENYISYIMFMNSKHHLEPVTNLICGESYLLAYHWTPVTSYVNMHYSKDGQGTI